ncbi:hypothetical protein CLOM_g12674 [Closterium sp. NIES-68]|nr:hypothetical protein CLOM_g12674 [Closterium sp. NIES-68]GJP82775.1 hypothetical protein CLOP_g13010 [Closterium sp. NIES-67]
MRALWGYQGVLSNKESRNPRFFDWNVVVPIYCDGGGFSGRRGPVRTNRNATIYLEGWKIMKAVLKDLLTNRPLYSARSLLLSGASAGGQAVATFCGLLANSVADRSAVKCLLDSAFFTDSPDRDGFPYFQRAVQQMAELHRSVGNPQCAKAQPPDKKWRCFFPQYALAFLSRRPVFIVQPLFDYRALVRGNQLPEDYNYAIDCLRSLLSLPVLSSGKRILIPSSNPRQGFTLATAYGQEDKEGLLRRWKQIEEDGYTPYPIWVADSPKAPVLAVEIQETEVQVTGTTGAVRGGTREAAGPTTYCKQDELVAILMVANNVARFTKMLRRKKLGAFLPLEYKHAVITSELWTESVVNGVTMRDAVASWYFS